MFRPKNWWGGIDETQKSCICHIRCSGCRRVCDRLGRAQRSRKEEEGGSCAARAAAGGVCRTAIASVREQGRPEVHIFQRLLRRERRRKGRQAWRMQGCQEGRRQEKGKKEK